MRFCIIQGRSILIKNLCIWGGLHNGFGFVGAKALERIPYVFGIIWCTVGVLQPVPISLHLLQFILYAGNSICQTWSVFLQGHHWLRVKWPFLSYLLEATGFFFVVFWFFFGFFWFFLDGGKFGIGVEEKPKDLCEQSSYILYTWVVKNKISFYCSF